MHDTVDNSKGGGAQKVLYTLETARKIGLLNSAKALSAKNTCKACGLGMGGQQGGMTNELGEFPSVCNKSIQAQSTDIQAPIPNEVFTHTIDDLQALSGYQMEHLGRLAAPLWKAPDEDRFSVIDWQDAIEKCIGAFRGTQPERSFFYSSGRSSNEAGFVLQLFARLYGTNNVSNCSYYCHQATGVALQNTIGTGTATVELDDLSGCDLVFLVGANPASNHPRLLHKLIELRRRGGQVVVINPMREPGLVKFAAPKMMSSMLKGGDEVASLYLQPRVGTDVALLAGIAKAVIAQGGVADDFVRSSTRHSAEYLSYISQLDWDELTAECGVSQETIEAAAKLYCQSKHAVFAWGMGLTHHLHGVENIEALSNLALLRGMVGRRFAGLLPLRGHSNVQGIGTIGVKPVLAQEVFARLEATLDVSLPRQPGKDTLACLHAAHAGEMDVAMMVGGNLYQASPHTQWTQQAFDRIGTKIFLTTTLNQGHVRGTAGEVLILPVCARDEEPEPTTQESMFNYVRLSDGGIERIASVRSETHVICDIAAGLLGDTGVDFNRFRTYRTIRQAIAQTVPGMEALEDIDVAKREFHINGRILHTPTFNTAEGRAAFVVPTVQASPAEVETYPFTLMSVRSEGQFNSMIYEEQDSYRGTDQRWIAMFHRQDLLEYGLSDGDLVDVRSAQGVMERVFVKTYDLPRGCIAVYYPEANVLTSNMADPRSHTPAFKSVPVTVTPSQG